MPIGLLRGIAGRALGLGGRAVDDVLNPVLRNARIKAGNILQQQLNPISRQAATRARRNIGRTRRAADPFETSLGDDVIEAAANPAFRNTVIVPTAGLATASALQAVNSAPANPIEQRLNQVGPAIDNFISGLNFPGQRTLEKFGKEQESRGLGAALELATPFGFLAAPFIPNSGNKKQDSQKTGMFQRGRVYGDLDAVAPVPGQGMFQRGRVYGDLNAVAPDMRSAPAPATPVSIAPAKLNGIAGVVDVDPSTGKGIPGTWRRGDMDAGPTVPVRQPGSDVAPPAPQLPPSEYPNLSPQERAYQQEVARTQQMAAANPYFQQMNLYGQGQRTMQSQQEMNQLRDLGLAINRSMYGDMTTPRTPNQLMAGLTPPGPAQPVIPMDEEGRIGQLDTAAAGVQDFMRKYAEGMKKRKGEE